MTDTYISSALTDLLPEQDVTKQINAGGCLVSIVVITYNSAPYILETLESIRQQIHVPIELIISDDCSKDDTITVCKKWLSSNGNRFVHTNLLTVEKNTGTVQNCNRGLWAATGRWIKFIGGDDALEHDIISNYLNFIGQKSDVHVVFSKMQAYINTFRKENISNARAKENKRFNSATCSANEQFQILLRGNCVDAPTVMFRTDVLKKLNGFDERFKLLEDWPMWLAITRAGYKMHYIDVVSVKYRMHAASVQELSKQGIYKSKVEEEVDEMFLKKYSDYMPIAERLAKRTVIYRDKAIIYFFHNKRSKTASLLSTVLGIVPSGILKMYRKKFYWAS